MPSENTKILEFNQYQKPDKSPFIGKVIYNKSKATYSIKFSMSTLSHLETENKNNVCRGKDCMKMF